MLQIIANNIFWFIIIISIIVFIHEFGHYYIAKKCGVKVETFSIGFGKELIGYTNKSGERWKICMIPFGGYVKMFGDRNEASAPDDEAASGFTEEEKKQSFIYKNVYQKIAIVAAGPAANFILGIFLFTILFKINGYATTSTVIDTVIDKSPAMSSGVKSGDKILAIDDKKVKDFVDLQNIIAPSYDRKIKLTICRDTKNSYSEIAEFEQGCDNLYEKSANLDEITRRLDIVQLEVSADRKEVKNMFGDTQKVGIIGIIPISRKSEKIGVYDSFIKANQETYRFSILIISSVKDLILGNRDLSELSGPIKIAQYSGKTASLGIVVMIWFMAVISINLGVINILPIPVLDGGHLLFYFFEAIFRRPFPKKLQEIGFRVGFALLVSLMIFTTFNDITNILKN